MLYRPAPPRPGKRGRPKLDGARFQGSDPATHGAPDAAWQGRDARGRAVSVTCWGDLHRKARRDMALTAIRVVRAGAAGTKRDPRAAWCWWLGGPRSPLAELPPLYARRFDKQHLLWAAPRLRTPARFARWTDLVAAAHHHLAVARPLAEVALRPWEARRRAASPPQVRRVMGRMSAHVGTPARPPRPRGKSPGRAPGAVAKRAARHPVVHTARQRPRRTAA